MSYQNIYHPIATVTVAIGATSAASAALPTGVKAVRLVSTVDCFVQVGFGSTASSSGSLYLPAFSPEYFLAHPGDQVSVIDADGTSTGSLYVTELSR